MNLTRKIFFLTRPTSICTTRSNTLPLLLKELVPPRKFQLNCSLTRASRMSLPTAVRFSKSYTTCWTTRSNLVIRTLPSYSRRPNAMEKCSSPSKTPESGFPKKVSQKCGSVSIRATSPVEKTRKEPGSDLQSSRKSFRHMEKISTLSAPKESAQNLFSHSQKAVKISFFLTRKETIQKKRNTFPPLKCRFSFLMICISICIDYSFICF